MKKFKDYIRRLDEASFKTEDLLKVCKLYGSLFSKGLSSPLRVWAVEDFQRSGESGSGVRMANVSGNMFRFNFSNVLNGFANSKSVVLSSIDYWEPGNVDLELPTTTCTFTREVNVIQIWKKLSDIITSGRYGEYTGADLGAMNEAEDDLFKMGDNRMRKDFLAGKGITAGYRSVTRSGFENTIADQGLEDEWREYVAKVSAGKPEKNSTEERIQKVEKAVKQIKYADPDVIFNDLVTLTKIFHKGKRKLLTVCGMGGLGKCVDVDTLVATPNGYVRAGDIRVGDKVFTPKNTVANVVDVYPQNELKECYEVVLSDGRSVVADEEQLFNVKINHLGRDSNYGKFKNVPLSEIIEEFNSQKNQLIAEGKWDVPNSRRTHIYFDVPDAVEYEHKDVSIDPYFLGLLIGDGGITEGIGFSNNDQNTLDWVRNHLNENYEGYALKYISGVDYRITRENYNPKGKTLEENRNILKVKLVELGLSGKNSHTKFIPESYKFNDIETRMELLRGLMDTDGYVTRGGTSSYSTVSLQLALDVVELVRSLGGVAKLVEKNVKYKESYRKCFDVRITLPFKMGSIVKNNSLKVERYNKRLEGKEFFKKLTVADIKPVGLRETICFRIDDPDHLFLTSDYMIVHNTFEIKHTLETLFGSSPNKHWIYIPAGKFTTLQFFQEVFDARDRIICFDEADNIVTNDEIVTMLKPALDTSGDGQMTYNTGTKRMTDMSKKEVEQYCGECDYWHGQEGVPFAFGKRFGKKENIFGSGDFDEDSEITGVWMPSRFYFTGKMIFISNLPLAKIDNALLTRGSRVDVTLTLQGKIRRVQTVLQNMHYPKDQIEMIVNYLEQQDDPEYVSVRTAVAFIDFLGQNDEVGGVDEAARLAATYG